MDTGKPNLLQTFIKLWQELPLWQHIHGASSHFPIALAVVSLLFDLIAFWRTELRPAAHWALVIAALGTIPSLLSGFTGYLGWFGVSVWQSDYLILHRNIAIGTSIILLSLALWRTLRRDRFANAERGVYLVVVFIAVVGVGITGWLGGSMAHGN